VGDYLNQLKSGNTEAWGEGAFNVASLFVGGAEIKGAADIAKASEADSLLAKVGVFGRALGETTAGNVRNLVTLPTRLPELMENTSALVRKGFGDVKNVIGAARETAGNLGTILEDSTKRSPIFTGGVVTDTGAHMNVIERVDFGQTVSNFGSKVKEDFGKNFSQLTNDAEAHQQALDNFLKDGMPEGKPPYSRTPDSWFKDEGGTIEVDRSKIPPEWTYIDKDGVRVSYRQMPDGTPDFTHSVDSNGQPLVKDSHSLEKGFDPSGNRQKDFTAYKNEHGPKQPGTTLHHENDGKTLQEVDTRLHDKFRHRGGVSKIKKGW
jgi:hypothetical protein